MNEGKELAVNLSQEELLYLLSIFRLSTLPGLDGKMLEGMSEREMAVAAGTAQRALFARGFIFPDQNGKIEVEEAVVALVGICALPSFSIVMEVATLKTAYGLYWHGTEHISVEHVIVMPGIHKFRSLPQGLDLAGHVTGRLPGIAETPISTQPAVTIDAGAFHQARDIARDQSDPKKAEQVLAKSGLPKGTAKSFATAMVNAQVTVTAAMIRHGRQGAKDEIEGGTAIFASEGSYFLDILGNVEPQSYELRPLGSVQWHTWVKEQVERITK